MPSPASKSTGRRALRTSLQLSYPRGLAIHSQAETPTIQAAVDALAPGPLTAEGIATHLRPLFTRTLSQPHIYLATHSLGRPLDAVEGDLHEGLSLWQRALSGAWEPWLRERESYRSQLAALIGAAAPHCVVPRGSAGQALRSVLNMLPPGARVLSTEGEFDSISMLLAQYASLGRIELELVPAARDESGTSLFEAAQLAERLQPRAISARPIALVVVSQVFFATGQLLDDLEDLASACHEFGACLLIDSYHSLGVIPIDVAAMGCDYLIGGCYKYLRGGPGAAFLYLSPQVLASDVQPLDTGWFALDRSPRLPGQPPRLSPGGDAHLEGTPAVLTWYQARSGLAFTRVIGVERLREYSLAQLQTQRALLQDRGIESAGGHTQHGAFLTVKSGDAAGVVAALAREKIIVNARGQYVRICPDCLTTGDELVATADALARCLA